VRWVARRADDFGLSFGDSPCFRAFFLRFFFLVYCLYGVFGATAAPPLHGIELPTAPRSMGRRGVRASASASQYDAAGQRMGWIRAHSYQVGRARGTGRWGRAVADYQGYDPLRLPRVKFFLQRDVCAAHGQRHRADHSPAFPPVSPNVLVSIGRRTGSRIPASIGQEPSGAGAGRASVR